ncbi:hypothetical protein OsJ_31244 [Oryza sativa Japonica Group]|uniref:Uncharacterized protein n=6 Tax=Oryza TaxID=4527 RepID=A0A8J8YJD5_ORYSJ|nr:expressed protein [Oryza sativa Japonica Group]EAZ15825.1 hypothetical protein OsJ_31244 [Oryza sativa Japonica Group]
MASIGFSYAQIHVQQDRCRRTNEEKMKKMMAEEEEKSKKGMCEGEEEEKNKFMAADEKSCHSWTSERVHPCSSPASKIGRLIGSKDKNEGQQLERRMMHNRPDHVSGTPPSVSKVLWVEDHRMPSQAH